MIKAANILREAELLEAMHTGNFSFLRRRLSVAESILTGRVKIRDVEK
jgi:hypothetical protein